MKRSSHLGKVVALTTAVSMAVTSHVSAIPEAAAMRNGHDATADDPMAMATAFTDLGCTAVAIAPHWLLSATHCRYANGYLAWFTGITRANPSNTTDPRVQSSGQVKAFTVDPTSDTTLIYTPVEIKNVPVFADLPSPDAEPQSGTHATNYGWGLETGNVLSVADSIIAPPNAKYPRGSEHNIFISLHQDGTDTKHGDSGGPLIQDGKVIGVVSTHNDGEGAIQYGNVAAQSARIAQIMQGFRSTSTAVYGYYNTLTPVAQELVMTPRIENPGSGDIVAEGLPSWLSIDKSTGQLRGTPSEADLDGQESKDFSFTISVPTNDPRSGSRVIRNKITVVSSSLAEKRKAVTEKIARNNETKLQNQVFHPRPRTVEAPQGQTTVGSPEFYAPGQDVAHPTVDHYAIAPRTLRLPRGVTFDSHTGTVTIGPDADQVSGFTFEVFAYFDDGSTNAFYYTLNVTPPLATSTPETPTTSTTVSVTTTLAPTSTPTFTSTPTPTSASATSEPTSLTSPSTPMSSATSSASSSSVVPSALTSANSSVQPIPTEIAGGKSSTSSSLSLWPWALLLALLPAAALVVNWEDPLIDRALPPAVAGIFRSLFPRR